MSVEDSTWLNIEEIQNRLERREVSAEELTEATLSRIERLDPRLESFAVVWPERARRAAARLDAARRAGEARGSLHGVPVALKDLCDVAGEPTRAGTAALGDVPAAENAEVVERLEAAGAVILGKVKMTEGAFVTHHESVTPPRNPWNAHRWTGISSSGSGVAVAAGLCTAALGTDTGGSIRYPSAACGLTGLKPTHGRISLRGVFPLADSLDHIGPMARSAVDAHRVFSALCGHDPRDPWSRAHNPPPEPVGAPPENLGGQRIGFDARFCEEGVDPTIRKTIQTALGEFRALGAEIVEFDLPEIETALGAWVALAAAEIATAHAETYPLKKDQYGAALSESIELGREISGRDVASAWKTRVAFARRLEGCFEDHRAGLDAIIAPVIPQPFPADTILGNPDSTPGAMSAVRYTGPFNLSGSPSLTLPGGFDAEEVPIGFQLIGAHLAEAKLLALGIAYQEATDWHARHPNL
ncbi:MAG: amidase [Myxococcota bacterium]|jgi:amidase|nr:amidase [Myxococcota bacterium]